MLGSWQRRANKKRDNFAWVALYLTWPKSWALLQSTMVGVLGVLRSCRFGCCFNLLITAAVYVYNYLALA